MTRKRVVADTNVLISRLFLASSVPGRAVRKAVDQAQLLVSEATLEELAEVLSRPKFDAWITQTDRLEFFRLFSRIAEMVTVSYPVQACRDPKDDKFLEVAVNGQADLILTGDKALLTLDPYHGVRIPTPARYLEA
jgi:uncharacterized protein